MKTGKQRKGQQPRQDKAFQPVVISGKLKITLALICALAGIALYINTSSHGYVLDDAAAVTGNQYVQQGFRGIPAIIRTGMWHFENVNLGYYRPLSMVTFAVENQLFPGNPHVSHLGNILLYGLTGFFLFLLLLKVFPGFQASFSFIITLLFLAHPLHTEVVANIKSRDELLSFLNMVIALTLLLKSYTSATGIRLQDANWKSLAASLVFFYLALLSKETAVTAVLLAPLMFYFSGRNNLKQCLTWAIPFLVVAVLFQIQKYALLGAVSGDRLEDIVNYPYHKAGAELSSAFFIFLWCARILVVPHPLSYDYSYNQIPAVDLSSPWVLLGIILLLTMCYAGFRGLQKRTPLSFGILMLLITLAPAMAFVLLRGGIFAERFLYAPSLGFCIMLAFILAQLSGMQIRSSVITINSIAQQWKFSVPFIVIFLLFSFKTVDRNKAWKDNITLFAGGTITSPNSCQTHRHYANELILLCFAEQDAGKKKEWFDKGVEQLRESLRINPHFGDALVKMGDAFQSGQANYDSAVYYYTLAIKEAPGLALGYNNLGVLYENSGKPELASYYYNKTVLVNPLFAEGVNNHNRHKQQTGLDVKLLPIQFDIDTEKMDTTGTDPAVFFQLGYKYASGGDYLKAIPFFEKAIQLNPSNTDPYINLANCYGLLEQYDKTIALLNKVLSYHPNDIQALGNLAITYEKMGDNDKAREYSLKKMNLLNGK